MDESFPGSKTRAALERGIPLFKNGLRFDAEMERAGQHVEKHGHTEGDTKAYPAGVSGF